MSSNCRWSAIRDIFICLGRNGERLPSFTNSRNPWKPSMSARWRGGMEHANPAVVKLDGETSVRGSNPSDRMRRQTKDVRDCNGNGASAEEKMRVRPAPHLSLIHI